MSTRDMVLVALFAAITAAFAVFPPVQVPVVPAPIVLQNIGVMLAGSILGARRGGLALLLFVVLVALGMPILTGWKGGFGVILGPTGGFVLSWILGAFVVGALVEKFWSRLDFWKLLLCNVIGGIVVVYALGIPWLAAVAGLELSQAFIGSAVFIPGDVVKAVVAAFAALIVKRSYPLIRG